MLNLRSVLFQCHGSLRDRMWSDFGAFQKDDLRAQRGNHISRSPQIVDVGRQISDGQVLNFYLGFLLPSVLLRLTSSFSWHDMRSACDSRSRNLMSSTCCTWFSLFDGRLARVHAW
eukprot:TRINITY_DN48700_c0_g1_i1.p1 TRINITY_DN48700_c0_g1~~TRINITY_DN48700_c0_g1_i1.p1  ORF type:complete len:116 (+),score=9.43 TRINITY_DN48700_c0_g1_i1:360-707(+)